MMQEKKNMCQKTYTLVNSRHVFGVCFGDYSSHQSGMTNCKFFVPSLPTHPEKCCYHFSNDCSSEIAIRDRLLEERLEDL